VQLHTESMTTNWVAGVDLGASKVALGLVSPAGDVVASRRFQTDAPRGPADVCERITQALGEMAGSAGIAPGSIRAVGVCSPGPVDHIAGMILDPPNLGWRNVPFRQMLADRLSLPVALEHDAKAAALGELHFGAGRAHAVRDLVYVIVGTGVGAAIILDGELYRGRSNSAGEIGHVTLDRRGQPGTSGVPGCVESFMSGPALVQHYTRRVLQPADGLSGQDVVQRAAAGDVIAQQVMHDAGDALGAAAATIAMLMDVCFFVIGGSVARAGDLLLAPARAAVAKYAFASVAARVQIVATTLHETAPILGCAQQARQLIERL
jgi:glucokinase